MSFFSGLSRPLRAAGVALIGVAVVAAVVGGISLATSGGSDNNTAGPSSSAGPSSQSPSSGGPSSSAPGSSSAPSSPSSPPPSSSAPGPSSAVPPGGRPTGQPGQPGGQPGHPGSDQQASTKWVIVRVYNNSLIKHLAEEAAADFRGAGWNVPEVGNYSQGVIDHTTAYYRPGTDEEAAAKQLATEFGFQALPRFAGIQGSSPGVIVIITKDYQSGHKGS